MNNEALEHKSAVSQLKDEHKYERSHNQLSLYMKQNKIEEKGDIQRETQGM